MPTAHGYLRVSTGKQGALGLDSQRLIVTDLYEKHLKDKYETLRIYEELHVSAHSIDFQDRPKGKEIGIHIQKGDCIIFPKLDRGFRSLRDTLTMFEYWKKLGVRIYSPDFGGGGGIFDSESMIGKLLVVMLGVCAEIEGDRVRQRMKDWEASQRKSGRAVAGVPDFGYKYVRYGEPTGVKNIPPAIIQPEANEQELMEFYDAMTLRGHSCMDIARHLKRYGVVARGGRAYESGRLSQYYKEWLRIKGMGKAAAKARGKPIQPDEFVTPDGVIAKIIPESLLDPSIQPKNKTRVRKCSISTGPATGPSSTPNPTTTSEKPSSPACATPEANDSSSKEKDSKPSPSETDSPAE